MKLTRTTRALCASLLTASAALFSPALRAADHGDAPTLGPDQGCDIADVFAFLDPSDNNQVVLIATFRGFIVPGENGNFGAYDATARYRFAIENTGDVRPDKFIDVTFGQRAIAAGASSPSQTATIKIGGLRGDFAAAVSQPTLNALPAGQTVVDLTNADNPAPGVKFFAGVVDDPFFFDIPAFNRFVGTVLANAPDPALLSRGRDSFAGYNCQSIALRLPKTLLVSAAAGAPQVLGVSFYAQRGTETTVRGIKRASRSYATVDRMGNPGVNVALVPFNTKNAYNAGTVTDDAAGKFAGVIVGTLTALNAGLQTAGLGYPPASNTAISTLAAVAVFRGDQLRLDLTKANTGDGGGTNATAAFPNGRRLADDTIDTILSIIAGVTVGDSVGVGNPAGVDDTDLQNVFPFLGKANQPKEGAGNIEDHTRN